MINSTKIDKLITVLTLNMKSAIELMIVWVLYMLIFLWNLLDLMWCNDECIPQPLFPTLFMDMPIFINTLAWHLQNNTICNSRIVHSII